MSEKSTALLIAGMHRSGTSLVASAVSQLGVEIGRQLVPSDHRNPRGYFEDVEFLALQRKVLQQCSPADDGGHPDWGWTPSEQLDRKRIARFRDEAQRLVDARSGRTRVGGSKDPRTTLLLDFWDEILDDARFLLVYRVPWEVADSMQRTGEEVFLRHPEWALPIWCFYNRHLIDFYRRHAERCLLVSANAVRGALSRVRALMSEKLGIESGEAPASDPFDPMLFRTRDLSDPMVSLTVATSHGAIQLLEQLEVLADIPTVAGGWAASSRPAVRFTQRAVELTESPVELSIVVPCFNDGELLLDAVASVERHAPDGCELIIVNDGSTASRSLEILRALRRLGYVVIDQDNAGLSAARNTGMRAARGRYLLPLDADNRLREGFLEAASACLDRRPEVGVVFGDRELFGWRTGRVAVAEFDLKSMLASNYIDACAVFRRKVWSDCGGYDTNLTGFEDWELWINVAKRGWRFHHLDAVTFDYRVRPGSLVEGSLHPKVLATLLAHIHRKHRDVFAAHLPLSLRWLGGSGAQQVSPSHGVRERIAELVNVAFWRSRWFFRRRAWRRHRQVLGRPAWRSLERA
ncbi:MAG: glycosyltransferase [Acidobacteriota bacterium]|nr:MAG: glycosyltransferase [Acidobacteriota bacterium]